MNQDQRGITIKAIKCKKENPLLTGVIIIIITILLFVTISGCATKQPTIINNNTVTQTASEKAPNVPTVSEPTATEASADKVTTTEETESTEGSASAEEETQPITQTKKPDIEIIHPEKETSWKENIGGIAKKIPEGYELWILVYSHEKEQYYPYSKVVPKYDQWVIKPIVVGFEDDSNKVFDIVAVLADKESQDIFNNYLSTAEENGENIYTQGIYLIPEGAKEYNRITLSRKSRFYDNTVN